MFQVVHLIVWNVTANKKVFFADMNVFSSLNDIRLCPLALINYFGFEHVEELYLFKIIM